MPSWTTRKAGWQPDARDAELADKKSRVKPGGAGRSKAGRLAAMSLI